MVNTTTKIKEMFRRKGNEKTMEELIEIICVGNETKRCIEKIIKDTYFINKEEVMSGDWGLSISKNIKKNSKWVITDINCIGNNYNITVMCLSNEYRTKWSAATKCMTIPEFKLLFDIQ